MDSPLRALVACVTFGLCVSACQAGTEPSGAVRMDLGGTVFQRPSPDPAVVPFTISNVSTRRVYLSRCGSRIMTAVDRYVSGHWSDYSGDGCPANQDMSPLPLEPGASLTSSRELYDAGVFRLRAGATGDPQQPYVWNVGLAGFEVR